MIGNLWTIVHRVGNFWNQRSAVFLTEVLLKGRIRRFFILIDQPKGRHKMPHPSPVFMKEAILDFPKSIPHFLISVLAEQQRTDGSGS